MRTVETLGVLGMFDAPKWCDFFRHKTRVMQGVPGARHSSEGHATLQIQSYRVLRLGAWHLFHATWCLAPLETIIV